MQAIARITRPYRDVIARMTGSYGGTIARITRSYVFAESLPEAFMPRWSISTNCPPCA